MMMFFMKIHNYLYNMSKFKYVTLMASMSFALRLPITLIAFFSTVNIDTLANQPMNDDADLLILYDASTILFLFIMFALVVPILETLVFQKFIIDFLQKNHIGTIQAILISSVIFGLMHNASMLNIINSSISGIVLAYSYCIYKQKKDEPFKTVCYIHGAHNFISMLLSLLFGFSIF